MSKYPIFLELRGRRVVVIGAGAVAVRKVQSLSEAGARVVVVAEKIEDSPVFTPSPNIELIKSKYSSDYLAGASLVIAATNNNELNRQIYKDCQEHDILCNVVDVPEFCDFFVPAVVKRGHLKIAIGTEGNCPAYAGHIRKKLEKIFSENHGKFLGEMETIRTQIINEVPDQATRKAMLGKLVEDESFEYLAENGSQKWRERAQKIINEFKAGL
jgi:precorrin-2 dehydrogenase/sirohydrochlorin ferrochelatase